MKVELSQMSTVDLFRVIASRNRSTVLMTVPVSESEDEPDCSANFSGNTQDMASMGYALLKLVANSIGMTIAQLVEMLNVEASEDAIVNPGRELGAITGMKIHN